MSRPVFLNHGISARERYDGVAANLFEIENERLVVKDLLLLVSRLLHRNLSYSSISDVCKCH